MQQARDISFRIALLRPVKAHQLVDRMSTTISRGEMDHAAAKITHAPFLRRHAGAGSRTQLRHRTGTHTDTMGQPPRPGRVSGHAGRIEYLLGQSAWRFDRENGFAHGRVGIEGKPTYPSGWIAPWASSNTVKMTRSPALMAAHNADAWRAEVMVCRQLPPPPSRA